MFLLLTCTYPSDDMVLPCFLSVTIEALSAALADNNTLKTINLSDNYIGQEGALALAEALTTNHTLVELQLRGNEIGDEGIKAIAGLRR